jgi:hypothetical protein
MPRLQIRREEFPDDPDDFEEAWDPDPRQTINREVGRAELLHAAFTSGHEQAFFEEQGGPADAMRFYCEWKRNAIEMSVREVNDDGVLRWGGTQMLKAMDPSERQGASYHLGLTVATVWARRKLQPIPYLLHLDLYRHAYSVQMQDATSRSRPDLIGLDSQDRWSVFECKGRKASPSSKDKKDAKRQTIRVQSIACAAPHERFAVFAFFGAEGQALQERCHLQALVIDPPGDANAQKPLSFDFVKKADFLERYYRPWVNFFDHNLNLKKDADGLLWIPMKGAKIEIALLAEVEAACRSNAWDSVPLLAAHLKGAQNMRDKYGYWAGDGLVVRA